MTTFLIVLNEDGQVQRVLAPANDEELDRLCLVHMKKNMILVTEKTEPILLQLCQIIDGLRDQLSRKTDFDYLMDELKSLIFRFEE